MKALTLTQPWATLVAIGAKKIETRVWRTNYRGELAIHAAKNYPDRGLRFEEPFYTALWQAGIKPDMPLVTGAIIAYCELLDCVETMPKWAGIEPWLTASWHDTTYHVPPGKGSFERAFGDYTPGRYAWLLGNVRDLPEPIPIRGALGLWEWTAAVAKETTL